MNTASTIELYAGGHGSGRHPEFGLVTKLNHYKETSGFKKTAKVSSAKTISHHIEYISPKGVKVTAKSSYTTQGGAQPSNRVFENGKENFSDKSIGKTNAYLSGRYGFIPTGKGYDSNLYGN